MSFSQARAQRSEGTAEYFPAYVAAGIKAELLDPELARFDVERLAGALKPERDLQFQFLGLQTLYDRYLLQTRGVRFELPQAFFMRVAMGHPHARSTARRAPSSSTISSPRSTSCANPTLFNAGTLRPQLSTRGPMSSA